MNDRYLYRAKRIDNDEWTYGYLYGIWERKYILWGMTNNIPDMTEVEPSTICQCTGLRDEDGKLIWENDICIITDGTLDEEDGYFRLDWEIDRAMFEFEGTGICANFDNVSGYDCEVVGNIFDNPELLEVEE
ncbi:MAG: YopX family protein [Lachnospiraceae bacterium]|nr:YopX family protein [Lachnospiraceae bacterium]